MYIINIDIDILLSAYIHLNELDFQRALNRIIYIIKIDRFAYSEISYHRKYDNPTRYGIFM